MKTHLILFVLLIPLTLQAEDAVREITLILQEQDDAWNRGDLDAFLEPYDETGKLVFLSTALIRSRDELKAKYEKRYGQGAGGFGKLTFTELQVEELAPGLARAWGKWNVQAKGQASTGWFTLILQRRNARWRIIHDHSS